MKNARRSLLYMACGAALSLTSPAYALHSGTSFIGAQVPGWAAVSYGCNGTLITPRVIVTARHCLPDSGEYGFFLRKTGQWYSGKTATYPKRYGPLGDVGILMTDSTFGGGAKDVWPAAVASYKEELQFLRNGNDAFTSGTRMVIWASDSSKNSFTTARTTDSFTGKYLGSGLGYEQGRKMFYRSVTKYRGTEPDRLNGLREYDNENIFNTELVGVMNGLKFTDQDADDAVVLTAPPLNTSPVSNSPIFNGDSGGGIFFATPGNSIHLVGTVSGTAAHARLSNYWPWIVKTLIDKGLRADAILLSQKVLGAPNWGTNGRVAEVGQIFVYDNPYTHKVEFFRLASLAKGAQYGYFPINQRDNENWEYLGTTLPNIEQATTPIKVWGTNDRRGVHGDIFIYNNPYTRTVEYFRLVALDGDGRYSYFPTNQRDNSHWKYLGTDLPTRALKTITPL